MNAQDIDFVRTINCARLELEMAGNPSYAVLTLDPSGQGHLSPMVFSTVGPAADHALRVSRTIQPDELVVIVSRSAGGQRAAFTVVDPKTLKRMHQRVEVIEQTFAETDGVI
ncbi:MAG: hypothetical protein JWQ20_2592 [Conexibacter sp.]|jgi:hypothetical protein|nr:hypothetical protein [Conexibacter sp.]